MTQKNKSWVITQADLGAEGGMSDWQPIETAPKDGTEILLYEPVFYNSPRMIVAYWEEHRDEWRIPADGIEYARDPTHWMHLPEPPK